MASIFSTNEIRDYLITKGELSARATNMQTYVLRFEGVTRGSDAPVSTDPYAKDPRLIRYLELFANPTIDVAVSTYGMGLNASGIANWVIANRPALITMASFLGDVVYTDLITNLVDTPPAVYRDMNLGDDLSQIIPTLSLKEAFARDCADVLTEIIKYMRHFATADVLDVNNMVIMKGLLDIF